VLDTRTKEEKPPCEGRFFCVRMMAKCMRFASTLLALKISLEQLVILIQVTPFLLSVVLKQKLVNGLLLLQRQILSR
jgi:hypothetical protein